MPRSSALSLESRPGSPYRVRQFLQRAALMALLVAPAAAGGDRVLLLDDFDGGIQNSRGGYRNTYESPPSRARSRRVPDVLRGTAGKSLRIEADKRESGFCGQWIHLFDMRSGMPAYLDAREFACLSCWVRGAQGGEQFNIRLADRAWIAREDSVLLGPVTDFLPAGVTLEWQQLQIPLRLARNIDLRELGGVILDFTTPGTAVVFLDELSLTSELPSPGNSAPARAPPESQGPPRLPPAASRRPRAMWVWSAQQMLHNTREADELLRFCRDERITELWIQLLYQIRQPGAPFEAERPPCRISHTSRWRELLRLAHRSGIRMHALDGAPEHALKQNHWVSLAVVDAVVEFNRAAPVEERFAGVHLDNEPYLLLGWEDPDRRESILREFLELNAECQRRVMRHRRDTSEHFEFGVDLPFWWHESDGPGGKAAGEVTFDGRRQPASYHCIDMLDNVGVMNYRDQADGADGMIFHGQDLLTYAGRTGRAEVYLGVETIKPEPLAVWFTLGLPRDRWLEALRGKARHLADVSRFRGFRLHRFQDGQCIHVGLEVPAHPRGVSDAEVRTAVGELALLLGAGSDSRSARQWSVRQARALAFLARDAEWREASPLPIPHPAGGSPLPGFTATHIMLPKITFGDDSPDDLAVQTGLVEEAFRGASHFRGFAVHCYESFREQSRSGQRVPRLRDEPSP